MWHNHINIAVLIYDTSYQASSGCEPCRVYQRRLPYNVLVMKKAFEHSNHVSPKSQLAQDVPGQTGMVLQNLRKNAMQAYVIYKDCYNKKAKASEPEERDNVHVIELKADHQGSNVPFKDFRWMEPSYLVEKALPNNNYGVRQIRMDKTQLLRCIRPRSFKAGEPMAEVQTTS